MWCHRRVTAWSASDARRDASRAGCSSIVSGRSRDPRSRDLQRSASLVAGDVPDRCGLLLDAELSARYRGTRRRRPVAARDPADRASHPVRDAADLSKGGGRKPWRTRLPGDARQATAILGRQAARPLPARLCGHLLDHHHHPVLGGRDGPHRREPLHPRIPAGRARRDHARAARGARCGVPRRVQ